MAIFKSRPVRIALIVLGLILVAFVSLAASVIIPFTRYAPTQDGTQLPGGAVLVATGAANAYILPDGDGHAALVDCGMNAAATEITAALAKQNLTPESVDAIFVTHAHPDHIAGCAAFPNARLFALDREVAAVEGSEVIPSALNTLTFARPAATGLSAIALHDGETVQLGSRTVTIFAVPGHTPGSAAYLSDGALFIGDAAGIAADGSTTPSPWIFNTDGAESARSLKALGVRLRSDDADVQSVDTGHSAPGALSALQ